MTVSEGGVGGGGGDTNLKGSEMLVVLFWGVIIIISPYCSPVRHGAAAFVCKSLILVLLGVIRSKRHYVNPLRFLIKCT